MAEFRDNRSPRIPGRVIQPVANAKLSPPPGREKRRGVRVNSRVPVAVEWNAGGQFLRKEAQTRVVGPYGCMVVLHGNLDVKQSIQLTNMVSRQSIPGVIVWRGLQRAEGWELGIELLNPQMGFWGLEL
jgi:hypothetical protein